jgi:hypothetical protein
MFTGELSNKKVAAANNSANFANSNHTQKTPEQKAR